MMARALLILALVTGILAPRMTAVAAQVVPGVEIIVICTGDSLQRIAIDAEGNPIDLGEADQHPCTLALAQIGAPTPAATWGAAALRISWSQTLRHQTRAARTPALPPPALGPPLSA